MKPNYSLEIYDDFARIKGSIPENEKQMEK